MQPGMIYIAQGEDAVGEAEDLVITTVLGSCIAVCLWDPVRRAGGMNHLLLPELRHGVEGLDTAGAVAMERLINQLVKLGAERGRLRAKLFGGSSMLSGMTDIGERNAAFGRGYIAAEGITCEAESLGGTLARKIRFWPATGAAKLKFVQEAPTLAPPLTIDANDVELF